jgi:hypothetical protein
MIVGIYVKIMPTKDNVVKVKVAHARKACEERRYSSTHSRQKS